MDAIAEHLDQGPRDAGIVANVQGISSLPTVRLKRKLGELPSQVLEEIKQAIQFALDLEPKTEAD